MKPDEITATFNRLRKKQEYSELGAFLFKAFATLPMGRARTAASKLYQSLSQKKKKARRVMTITQKASRLADNVARNLPEHGVSFRQFVSRLDKAHGKRDAISRQVILATTQLPELPRKLEVVLPKDVFFASELLKETPTPLPPPQ